MREFLNTSELLETRAFVHSFVKKKEVKRGNAAVVYTVHSRATVVWGSGHFRGCPQRASYQFSECWWDGAYPISNSSMGGPTLGRSANCSKGNLFTPRDIMASLAKPVARRSQRREH